MAQVAERSNEELLALLASVSAEEIEAFVGELDEEEAQALLEPLYDWEHAFARPSQTEPTKSWRTWLIQAGRGFGKTRVGAEAVRKRGELGLCPRMALLGRSGDDARKTMVEGISGIVEISPPWCKPLWQPAKKTLTWPRVAPSGVGRISLGPPPAQAFIYTAEKPEQLRGPAHHFAWVDELAAHKSKEAWDQLQFGLRLGDNPQQVVTTTPKPLRLLRELIARATTVLTTGSSYENLANLAQPYVDEVIAPYEGTELGEQEIHGKLLEEAEGALWRRRWIEKNRVAEPWAQVERVNDAGVLTLERVPAPPPDLVLVATGVDPPGGGERTEAGIVTVGVRPEMVRGKKAWGFYTLDDASGVMRPNEWAEAACDQADRWGSAAIVAETNFGGDMVISTIETHRDDVPVQKVTASVGKRPRAEPVALLAEQGADHHCGQFRDLEDELCNWDPLDTTQPSPNRLDAKVWAVRYLMARIKRSKVPTFGTLPELRQRDYWSGGEE